MPLPALVGACSPQVLENLTNSERQGWYRIANDAQRTCVRTQLMLDPDWDHKTIYLRALMDRADWLTFPGTLPPPLADARTLLDGFVVEALPLSELYIHSLIQLGHYELAQAHARAALAYLEAAGAGPEQLRETIRGLKRADHLVEQQGPGPIPLK